MAGQDWFEKDFYATLGVPKDADAAAIKKAYRKLARTLHPDHNPGDAVSEAKFKEVGEAYAVLSDPEQRQQYDAIRAMAGGGARFSAPGSGGGQGGSAAGFDDLFGGLFGGGPGGPGGPRPRYAGQQGAGGPDLEDLLGGLFGGGGGARGGPAGFRPNAPQGSSDLHATTTLPFRQAVTGSTVSLQVNGRKVNARIPPGVRNGQKIRIPGKGGPAEWGMPAGDLVLTVTVEPHPVFSMEGHNLRVTVPVTFDEATLGAEIEVPTLEGARVRVRVPAGTPSGRTLRVKGRGVQLPQGNGDLLVTIQVAVPQRLSDEARAAVEAFAAATSHGDVRADFRAKAAS